MILIAGETNLIIFQIKSYFWIILQWWLVWWGVAIVRAELTPPRDVSQLTKKGVIIIFISTTIIIINATIITISTTIIIIIIGTTITNITVIIITTVWSNRRCELVGFDDMKCTKHPAVVAKYVKVKLYFVPISLYMPLSRPKLMFNTCSKVCFCLLFPPYNSQVMLKLALNQVQETERRNCQQFYIFIYIYTYFIFYMIIYNYTIICNAEVNIEPS